MKISRNTIFQISKQELEEILSDELSQQGYEFDSLKFAYLYDRSGTPDENRVIIGVEIISEYEE